MATFRGGQSVFLGQGTQGILAIVEVALLVTGVAGEEAQIC